MFDNSLTSDANSDAKSETLTTFFFDGLKLLTSWTLTFWSTPNCVIKMFILAWCKVFDADLGMICYTFKRAIVKELILPDFVKEPFPTVHLKNSPLSLYQKCTATSMGTSPSPKTLCCTEVKLTMQNVGKQIIPIVKQS
jgi:hypothetical protein